MKSGNLILATALILCGGTYVSARSTTYGRAIADVQSLANGCETFRLDYGQYPQPKNWWEELRGADSAIINTKQKVYVDLFSKTDPWGSEYQYMLLSKKAEKLPMVYSLGKDKITKSLGHDPDDISSWRDYQIPLNHYQPPFFSRRRIIIGAAMVAALSVLLLYLRSKRVPTICKSKS